MCTFGSLKPGAHFQSWVHMDPPVTQAKHTRLTSVWSLALGPGQLPRHRPGSHCFADILVNVLLPLALNPGSRFPRAPPALWLDSPSPSPPPTPASEICPRDDRTSTLSEVSPSVLGGRRTAQRGPGLPCRPSLSVALSPPVVDSGARYSPNAFPEPARVTPQDAQRAFCWEDFPAPCPLI